VLNRRRLLGVPLLGALPTCVRAGTTPEDLVLVQPGTLPILLTAPHGGRMPVPGVEQRKAPDRVPKGMTFVTDTDPQTDRLAEGIAARVRTLTQADVHLVVARFERKYIDANRAPEIAFDSTLAGPYYDFYHRAIRRVVDQIRQTHRHGLLLDIHGQHKMPDALVRGTINGRSVRRLLDRAGIDAVTGDKGLFGQLERQGFQVFPANSVPPAGHSEDAGFSGGYTTHRYGSHRPDGIDAVQLEFGSEYRKAASLASSIDRSARAIAAFHAAYLT
jgi:N-formylglutamate amidohydrolase